jgi:ribosomal-protein-alanine N-acetyltransferase
MGSGRGRFGKYGELKRLDRLRKAGIREQRRPGSKQGPQGFKHSRKHGFRKAALPSRIRPAKPSDLKFIALLSEKIFHPYGPYGEVIGDWFTSRETITLVAVTDRQPVGFVMLRRGLSPGFPSSSEIMAIGVEPAWRKRGVGMTLLKEIEQKAKEMDIKVLFLHTAEDNLQARRLFEKSGFSLVDRKGCFYPRGQDALLMSKKVQEVGETPFET